MFVPCIAMLLVLGVAYAHGYVFVSLSGDHLTANPSTAAGVNFVSSLPPLLTCIYAPMCRFDKDVFAQKITTSVIRMGGGSDDDSRLNNSNNNKKGNENRKSTDQNGELGSRKLSQGEEQQLVAIDTATDTPVTTTPHTSKSYFTKRATNFSDPDIRNALMDLQWCQSYECVQTQHELLKGKTRFNFPHFFLIGWQKCATTSINSLLRRHPEFLPGWQKESHWFTACQLEHKNPNCKAPVLRRYLREFLRIDVAGGGGLVSATGDASVDYGWKGEELAQEIYSVFPWIKVAAIMREPISRMVSYTRMYTARGELLKGCKPKSTHFQCLQRHLVHPKNTYAEALEGWLRVFPAQQLQIMQFEDMQEDSEGVMYRLKEFLDLDPQLPVLREFRNVNSRQSTGGYEMTREEYDMLVEIVREPSEKVARLLEEKGLYNGTLWLGRWQAVWERMRSEACDAATGQCVINSN